MKWESGVAGTKEGKDGKESWKGATLFEVWSVLCCTKDHQGVMFRPLTQILAIECFDGDRETRGGLPTQRPGSRRKGPHSLVPMSRVGTCDGETATGRPLVDDRFDEVGLDYVKPEGDAANDSGRHFAELAHVSLRARDPRAQCEAPSRLAIVCPHPTAMYDSHSADGKKSRRTRFSLNRTLTAWRCRS